jgi:hypothetical protein
MPDPARSRSRREKAPQCGAFPDAPEKTRTSTDHTVHKALNHVRAVWMRSAASRSCKSWGLLHASDVMERVDVVTSVVTLAAFDAAPRPAHALVASIYRNRLDHDVRMAPVAAKIVRTPYVRHRGGADLDGPVRSAHL